MTLGQRPQQSRGLPTTPHKAWQRASRTSP